MQASANYYAKLELVEGKRLTAYQDQAGVWTIGIGHTGDVAAGAVIDEATCLMLAQKDTAKFEACVNKLVTVPLSQAQFDALVLFAFNEGEGAFGGSHLLVALNAGNMPEVAVQWMRWTFVKDTTGQMVDDPGLRNRRLIELAMWQSDTNTISAGSAVRGATGPVPSGAITGALAKSSTIYGALVAGLGGVLSFFDTIVQSLTDAAQQIPHYGDVASLLSNVGINAKAAIFGLTIYGVMQAIKSRLSAATQGKIG